MSITSSFAREALSHLPALQNFARNLCGDAQRSSDLVQETMLKACRNFHTFREGTNCRAWLFQICKNSFINEYRRKRLEPLAVDFQGALKDPVTGLDNERYFGSPHLLADDSLMRQQGSLLGDEVSCALEHLPLEYQTALILSDIEGCTYEEIAEFMRAPIGTIRSRIHRGRKILARSLAGYAQQLGYKSLLAIEN